MTKSPTKTTPTTRFRAFRPDAAIDAAMLRLSAKTGISFSRQITRALDAWLPKQKDAGYTPKKERKQ
jgi:hypothetical protein